MVNHDKMLKLGGFSKVVNGGATEHEGFAKKQLPPDTPHREDKERWRINQLGQAVPDEGVPQEELRQMYIDAFLQEEDEEERADHVRSLGTMAEQGDQECAKVLLSWLETTKSALIRKQILRKLVWAGKTPHIARCREIIEGIKVCITDDEASIRGMMVETLDFAVGKSDTAEIDNMVPVDKRPGATKLRGTAWHKMREVALALSERVLMSGLLTLFTHAVLPVRMATWCLFAEKLDVVQLSRCKEFERRMHRRRLTMAQAQKEMQAAADQTEQTVRAIFDERRAEVANTLREEAHERGVDPNQALQDEIKDRFLEEDGRFQGARDALEAAKDKFRAAAVDFESENALYVGIAQEIHATLLSLLGTVLEEPSVVLDRVSTMMGRSSKGHWYVRRVVLTAVTPLALAEMGPAAAMLERGLADRSPYVRRIAERSLRALQVQRRHADARAPGAGASPVAGVARVANVDEKALEAEGAKAPQVDERTEMVRELLDLGHAVRRPGSKGDTDRLSRVQSADSAQERPRTGGGPDHKHHHGDRPGGKTGEHLHGHHRRSLHPMRSHPHSLDAGSEEGKTPVQETPEEYRRRLKQLAARKKAADEEEELRRLNVASYDWREVRELIETLRIHFLEATDLYKNAIKDAKFDGQQLIECTDDDLKATLRMTMRKHRLTLRQAVKARVESFRQRTDEEVLRAEAERRMLDAAREAAEGVKQVNARIREEKGEANLRRVMRAMRNDNYVFGDTLGVGAVLQEDSAGQIIFNKVIPLGGLVSEYDVLVEVAGRNVEGCPLTEVMQVLLDAGEQCTCVIRLGSQKERLAEMRRKYEEWREDLERLRASINVQGKVDANFVRQKEKQIAEQESMKVHRDLLRTVRVTCLPPPYGAATVTSMGLDVEIYPTDAVRALQLLSVMKRTGFTKYIRPVLIDSEVRSLHALAAKNGERAWLEGLNMRPREATAFEGLLARLAARFVPRKVNGRLQVRARRPHACGEWLVVQGRGGVVSSTVESRYRTRDACKSAHEFRAVGRTPVKLKTRSEGLEYTLFYSRRQRVAVELSHSSNGAVRVLIPPEARPPDLADVDIDDFWDSREDGAPQAWALYPDGEVEPTRGLRAQNLLESLTQDEPVPPPGDGSFSDAHGEGPLRAGSAWSDGRPAEEVAGAGAGAEAEAGGARTRTVTFQDATDATDATGSICTLRAASVTGVAPGDGGGAELVSGRAFGKERLPSLAAAGSGGECSASAPAASSAAESALCRAPSDVSSLSAQEAAREGVRAAPAAPPEGHAKKGLLGSVLSLFSPKKPDRALPPDAPLEAQAPPRATTPSRTCLGGVSGRPVPAWVAAVKSPPGAAARARRAAGGGGGCALVDDLCAALGRDMRHELEIVAASGQHFGFFGLFGAGEEEEEKRHVADDEAAIDSDEEEVVGYHVEAEEGMRVKLRESTAARFPALLDETGGTVGTVTWADPEDADGDGWTGDICEVKWDNGFVGDYRTGFEGCFRLRLHKVGGGEDGRQHVVTDRHGNEKIVGLDVSPVEGMRVLLRKAAITENAELLADSGGGPGLITWVDPTDADGDGVTGDICSVKWDFTGIEDDYRTGFEGCFRLCQFEQAAGVGGESDDDGGDGIRETWEYLEELEREKAALHEELLGNVQPPAWPEPGKVTALQPHGKYATIRAGNWLAKVIRLRGSPGSTIQVTFHPHGTDEDYWHKVNADLARLGHALTSQERDKFVAGKRHAGGPHPAPVPQVHLTDEGALFLLGAPFEGFRPGEAAPPPEEPPEDPSRPATSATGATGASGSTRPGTGASALSLSRPETAGSAAGAAPAGGGGAAARAEEHRGARALRADEDGLSEMAPLHAQLLVRGVALAEMERVAADVARVGPPLSPVLRDAVAFERGERGRVQVVTPAAALARSGKVGLPLVPQSRRSNQAQAVHEMPVRPVTGRPFSTLRPSSMGGLRQTLGLEDVSGLGQEMHVEGVARNGALADGGDAQARARLSSRALNLIND